MDRFPGPLHKVFRRDGRRLPREEAEDPHRALRQRQIGGGREYQHRSCVHSAGDEERNPETEIRVRGGPFCRTQSTTGSAGEGRERL